MINGSIINNLLSSILGTKNPIDKTSETSNVGYICLGYNVETDTDNNIISFDEPSAASGYKRYLIGAYSRQGNAGDLVNKVKVARGKAYNTDTLYFDEALEDWTAKDFLFKKYATPEEYAAFEGVVVDEGEPDEYKAVPSDSGETRIIKYFGIINTDNLNEDPIAYGYIIGSDNKETALTVKNGQVPIIRKNQLQLSIEDLKELPTEDYFAKVSYQAEGAPTPAVLYNLKLRTTNIEKVVDNILYTQVVITDLEVVTPQEVVTVLTLNEGDVLFIANIKQIVDQETLVNFYDNNLTIYPEVKVQVFSRDPNQE